MSEREPGRKIRLAILYGGRSAEHEVSVVSARSMMAAIDRTKYDVIPIAITKSGRWLLPAVTPDRIETVTGSLPGTGEEGTGVALVREGRDASLRPLGGGEGLGSVDVVFPVLHGPYGEDGTVQGLLELAGVARVSPCALGPSIR